MGIRRSYAIVAALGLALGAIGAVPGQAAAHSQYQYDGTNPAALATDCDGSTLLWGTDYITNPSGTRLARVDLVYSTVCSTVWTRVTNMTGGTATIATGIFRSSPYANYDYVDGTCPVLCKDPVPAGKRSWGAQLYIPQGFGSNGEWLMATGYFCTESTCRSTKYAKQIVWT